MKFPAYILPGPPVGSPLSASSIALRNMPVIGDAEYIDATILYVSFVEPGPPTSNTPGEGEVNVAPLVAEALWIETSVMGLDNIGDAAVV